MPYKHKRDKAKQMRRYRRRKKELRERAKRLEQARKEQLKTQFPDIYTYVFGLDLNQKKKRKREK